MRQNLHFDRRRQLSGTVLSLFCSLLLLCRLASRALAFHPTIPTTAAAAATRRREGATVLNYAKWNDDEDERYEQALANNQLRTDVRMFLTQRAVQSFMFLLISCRDPHTVRWLEDTYEFGNLEEYHGTGALNPTRFETWDAFLLDLLQRPSDVVVVAARRRGRGQGGWTTDNPHLPDRFVEFEIDIEPASLVTRLVSVRQQIAAEWVADLDTLVAVNALILESYHETQQNQQQDGGGGADAWATSNRNSNLPLERYHAYERKATLFLHNKMEEHRERTGHLSSPLRKDNFDLLALLATQQAIHVVLRRYLEQGDERRVSLEWLREFYTDRVALYFDGHGKHGRADDFLQDLLLAPPSVVTPDAASPSENVLELVDPLRIAEDILTERSRVALEWKEIMEKIVPSDHMELQKSILAVRMGQTPDIAAAPAEHQEEATVQQQPPQAESSGSSDDAQWDALGEFE